MSIALRSFAKINLGLKIGPPRPDGFHELRTIYQTIALHDVVRVEVAPVTESKFAATIRGCRAMRPTPARRCRAGASIGREGFPRGLKSARKVASSGRRSAGTPEGAPLQNKVIITIEKHLPVQGGMGAASSNAVAAMLGLERALGVELSQQDKLRIAAEVGSDLPLFLIGGTVLGVDRGQEVYALQDLPETALVVVTPPVGVSTPKAFAQWDALMAISREVRSEKSKKRWPDLALRQAQGGSKAATGTSLEADRLARRPSRVDRSCARRYNKKARSGGCAWLSERLLSRAVPAKGPASGVPAAGGDRAETPLLDLVRTGIENDFERVVFPEYPELREVKSVLQREGARYASLSGSGSTVYGLFESAEDAEAAAERMRAAGHAAVATRTMGRSEYWKAVASSQLPVASEGKF